MNTPKTARDSSISSELFNLEAEETFRKSASAFGLSDFAVEEALHELRAEKTASTKEERFMSHLRSELFKMAKSMGADCPYSPRELTEFTSSPESFQKAAMLEARSFWTGLSEDLVKRGRDKSFLDGMLKTAEDFSEDIGATLAPQNIESVGKGLGQMAGTVGSALQNVWDTTKSFGGEAAQKASQGVDSLSSVAKEIGNSAGTAGSSLMDTAKETAGRLKEQAGPAVEQFKQNANKALTEGAAKGKSVFQDLTSSLTPEDDRHRRVPGMGNQFLGAAGGALLSALLGGQLGLSGPAAWLVPLLGGAAGYHYLPKLMNMWKDAPGSGVNSVSPGAQMQNQQNPLVGPPAPFVGAQPPQFTGSDVTPGGATMSPGVFSGTLGQKAV
jgi:hypothetical protein